MAQLKQVTIPASHGHLEGLLRLPEGGPEPTMAAVVCHPHPLYGGTMHNKTVFRLAAALNEVGMPTLRFNFRGVGLSTSSYDEGRGEQEDIRAALDALSAQFPRSALCVAGFSFGAWTGLRVGCTDARVSQLVGAGVPTSLLGVEALATCTKPKLLVQGALDQYGPLPEIQRWVAGLPDPKQLEVIANADHHFTGHLDELFAAVVGYFTQSGSHGD